MKASQIRPVGNKILVLVNGPHASAKDESKIVLPDFMQYPQMECEVKQVAVLAMQQIGHEIFNKILLDNVIIGNKAGVMLGVDDYTGKEMRLITPSDILLIL